MTILTGLAWLTAAPVLTINAILAIELAVGLPAMRKKPQGDPDDGPTPRTMILMPAHNEAGGITRTIESMRPHLNERVSLLVVADNCSDDTAALAREAGAQVIERQQATLRGKGHALAFGRDWMKADPPECVIVCDADCAADPGTIDTLARTSVAYGRPAQACNLLRSRADDGPMVQISNFAFLIKNKIRQRGGTRIGAPAILTGTGMALPWSIFESAPLATSDLVEDLALGIDYARNGKPGLFVEHVTVWSDPASAADTLTQRTRWEHGFVSTAMSRALPLVAEGITRLRPGLSWLGLHLLVPPLALLVSLTLLALGLTSLFAIFGASLAPAAWCASALAAVAVLLTMNWSCSGRDIVRGETLARIPLYLLWKLPVYLKLARKRESKWVRTKRDGED